MVEISGDGVTFCWIEVSFNFPFSVLSHSVLQASDKAYVYRCNFLFQGLVEI